MAKIGDDVVVFLFLLTLMYAVSVWRKQRRHLKAYAAVQVVQIGG